MKKPGKVLRDPRAGPGLLMVEGQQCPFSVPGAWRSQQPPARGMPVEVEFGSAGEILAIRPVSEAQIAKAEGTASRIIGRLFASLR
jgi:hypothetical protein